jgi:anaerobic selenocysteine-containing dehydrogenase
MCACRCGINVHLRAGADGTEKIRYIEGNRDYPVNRGVLCAKGSAGIMQHYTSGVDLQTMWAHFLMPIDVIVSG